jgi:hypothetical protein
MVPAILIIVVIAIPWLIVVTATIGVCRVAARSDAEEVKLYREARRRGAIRRGHVSWRSDRQCCWLGGTDRRRRQLAGSALAGETLHTPGRDLGRLGRTRTSVCRR